MKKFIVIHFFLTLTAERNPFLYGSDATQIAHIKLIDDETKISFHHYEGKIEARIKKSPSTFLRAEGLGG